MPELLEQLNESLSGRYALEREIGLGGMAVVYLARDQKHDRQVAVKVVHPELTPALGQERFLREIGIASKLTHPHILPLYDSGEAGGHLFYVMPYIEGESLRERLSREGPLSVDAARQMAREVGSALSYAHDHGIVHRDIKPENIMLSGGHAVVTDFGVAKALTDAGGDQLTKTGFATGTPQYMSPEQAAGEATLDARSDQYALACVMYETLAGEPPFTGPTSQAVIARHTMDPVPSLRTVRSAVPAALEAAVERALEKMPADRFDSVEQFVEAVTAEAPAVRAEPLGEVRARATPKRLGWAVAAIALATVAVLAARQFDFGGLFAPAPEQERVAIIDFQDLGLDPELQHLAIAIPEFLSLALTGETGGAQAIDRRQVVPAWERALGASNDPAAQYAAVAKDLGATHVITGQLIPQPNGSVLAQADLMRGREIVLQSRQVVLPASEAIAVAESLGVQLLAASAGELERLPGLVSSSTRAVQEWLVGTQAFRRGEYVEALESFSSVLDEDSTFALAAWGMMLSAGWLDGFGDEYRRGRRLAWAHRERLLPGDSAVFVAESQRNGYPEAPAGGEHELFTLYQRAVQLYPGRWDAWFHYGDYLWHEGGAYVDDGRAEARRALERAIELDSTAHGEPWEHMADNYFESLDEDGFRSIPVEFQNDLYAIYKLFFVIVDPDADLDEADWEQLSENTFASIVGVMDLQALGVAMDGAERLSETLEQLAADGDGNTAQVVGNFRLNRGQPSRATPLLRIAATSNHQHAEMWLLAGLYWDAEPDVVRQVRDSLEAATSDVAVEAVVRNEPGARYHLQERCWIAITDQLQNRDDIVAPMLTLARDVESTLAMADDFGSDRSDWWIARLARLCAATLDARIAVEARDPDALTKVAIADSAFGIGANSRYQAAWQTVLADLWEEVGEPERAIGILRRFWLVQGEERTHFLSARVLRRARIAAELGLTDEALKSYEHYLTLRAEPEPVLEAQVAAVRAEYEALRD